MEEKRYIVIPSVITGRYDAIVYRRTSDGEKPEVRFYACCTEEDARHSAEKYINRK